jgi:transcriptional regulator with XRE-family HTH domain
MTANPDIEAIRGALRTHMRLKKMGGRKLAREAGLGESAVRDILTTVVDPRISTLYRLANALEISISALLEGPLPGSETPPPEPPPPAE